MADSVSDVIHVAAPLRVRDRLTVAADGPRQILHASSTAIHFDLDGWCLGLLSSSATRMPCALWSSLPDLGHLTGGPVRISDGVLLVADEEVRITRLAETRVPPLALRREDSATQGIAAQRFPTLRNISGVELPHDGRLTTDHADRLLGRGPGLTPLGDDVLAGWFATRHAAGRPDANLAAAVRRRLGVTTLLSATLLDCALHGEALPQLASWLAEPTPIATEALVAIGATSGTGLLTGAELALASLATDDHPGRAA